MKGILLPRYIAKPKGEGAKPYSMGRHAIVFSEEVYDPDRAHFGESIAVRRGIGLRVFPGLEEAMCWLHSCEGRS